MASRRGQQETLPTATVDENTEWPVDQLLRDPDEAGDAGTTVCAEADSVAEPETSNTSVDPVPESEPSREEEGAQVHPVRAVTITRLVREALRPDPEMRWEDVLAFVRARGVESTDHSIRQTYYAVRNQLRRHRGESPADPVNEPSLDDTLVIIQDIKSMAKRLGGNDRLRRLVVLVLDESQP